MGAVNFNAIEPGPFSPDSRIDKGLGYSLDLIEARRFCSNTRPASNVRRRNPRIDRFKGPGLGPGMVDLDCGSGPFSLDGPSQLRHALDLVVCPQSKAARHNPALRADGSRLNDHEPHLPGPGLVKP